MKKRIYIYLSIFILFIIFILSIFGDSYAVSTQESIRVKENTDLTYYIDIIYDGKDKNLIMSNDSTMAEIHSDYIYVEDKIPNGLTFKKFITSDDGSIGAVQRNDSSKTCSGYVVDGNNGLTYDETTRTASFKVKNLKAGCKITVGIITTTPSLSENQKRMDFYNTAYARESVFTTSSNTTHAYIGEEEATLYDVIYQYEGEIPPGAPSLPKETAYLSGSIVTVDNDINLDRYIFSGWSTSDVNIDDNNTFIMPEKTVTFTGSFSKKDTYQVTYDIDGEYPDGFIPPKTKEYGEGDIVNIDSLSSGDEINGYRFLGWETTDISIIDDTFIMPKNKVEFIGKFEKISYTVTYKFQGDIIPENATNLLPEVKSYYPNDEVTIEENPVTDGYHFLGWYYPEKFNMPEENVIIYGEWMLETGKFSPVISTTIINPKDYYNENDEIQFKITITNNENFTINNVILQNHLTGSSFIENENYVLLNSQFVKILSISPKSNTEVFATYIVGDEPLEKYSSIVTLNGASSNNNYNLDTSKEYKTELVFNVANISLQINKIDEDNNSLSGAEFKLYTDNNKTELVSTGTTFTKLNPSTTYYLEETKAPYGFVLLEKTLIVVVDDSGNISIDGYDVYKENEINKVNILNKKINILPNTGGLGNIPYIIIGLIIIIVSLIGYIKYITKNSRKYEKENDNT